MSIKATILAGALGLPLFAGTALAAETKIVAGRCRQARGPRDRARAIERPREE